MIDLSNVVREVRLIASEYPEVKYPQTDCRYTVGRCGPGYGCLVGQAIQSAHPEDMAFLRIIDNDHTVSIMSLARSNKERFKWHPNDLFWLAIVQGRQDSGHSWIDAVKGADAKFS